MLAIACGLLADVSVTVSVATIRRRRLSRRLPEAFSVIRRVPEPAVDSAKLRAPMIARPPAWPPSSALGTESCIVRSQAARQMTGTVTETDDGVVAGLACGELMNQDATGEGS